MALINCPECKRKVSDKAELCPNCGCPIRAQTATTAVDILAGHRWMVQSQTLGNGMSLAADFDDGGSFGGQLTAPPGYYTVQTQQVRGKWHVAGSLLILEWDWMQVAGRFHEEVPIEISNLSEDRLQGVDKWFRLWEFQRIG
jgi:hypothetical protein